LTGAKTQFKQNQTAAKLQHKKARATIMQKFIHTEKMKSKKTKVCFRRPLCHEASKHIGPVQQLSRPAWTDVHFHTSDHLPFYSMSHIAVEYFHVLQCL